MGERAETDGARGAPATGRGQLGELTPAETLLIDRRRRGETQSETAARLDTTRSQYQGRETGRLDSPDLPTVEIDSLQPSERCLLYRRRAGYTQARVARELGRSRWWVLQMERGAAPCDELLWYWEQ